MHTRRLIFQVFIALFLWGTISCSEEVRPSPYTFTKVFTGTNSKTWAIDYVVLRETGKDDERITLESCERDDRYIFYANAERLYEVTNGRLTCDAEEEQTLVTYNWAFVNATSTLTIVVPHFFGNFIIPFIVKEVDKNEMVLELYLDEDNSISYVFYFEAIEEN